MNDAQCKSIIEDAVIEAGLSIQGWDTEDRRPRANLGEVRMTEDIVDYTDFPVACEGEMGTLFAAVVGAEEFHNVRVAFMFQEDGCDEATTEIGSRDIMKVEPI